ncbi:hypothetical protein DYB37_007986 [Aphanomyces astaci]|uniref:Uncharacterized protein n=1 Tax=Aphanomyces astaci TaxID=112090 RepID=A0A3R6YIQ1_APHAT|nr:hypothetical protein DYB37_007986 [Aphanomyces astaci]
MAPGRRDLTNDEREAILRETLLKSNGSYASRLPKGFGPYLASKYQCNVSCIRKILARAKDQGVATGNMQVSVTNKKKGKVGRKHAFTAAEVKAKLLQVLLIARRFDLFQLTLSREAVKEHLDSPSTYGDRYKGRPGKLLLARDRVHLIRRAAASGQISGALVADLPFEVSAQTVHREFAGALQLKYSKLKHTSVL